MAATRGYDRDYLDACQARSEAQVATWREVAGAARDHGDADVSGLDSALAFLESEYFNNMLLVLELSFVDRPQEPGRHDRSALDEVRLLARSLVEDGGMVLDDPALAVDPEHSVLGLRAGDSISLTQEQYLRLANAFFREAERSVVA
jgi:hypothetical protein